MIICDVYYWHVAKSYGVMNDKLLTRTITYDVTNLSILLFCNTLSLSLFLSVSFASCFSSLSFFASHLWKLNNAEQKEIFIYYHNQWMYRPWLLVSLVYYLTENTYFPSLLTFAIAKLLSESLRFTLKCIHDKLLRYSGLRQNWGQNTDIDMSRPVSAFFSSAGKVCFQLFMRVVSQRYDYGFLVGGLLLRKKKNM